MIHESIVERITPSMRAHVQFEGIGDESTEGHVTSIAPMTTFNWRSTVGYFQGIVKLDSVPEGLKPGMSAEVELSMPGRENVLAVPSEAIVTDHGYDICFVVHEDSLERRQVTVGNTTRTLVEVTQGLEAGEQVVLNPQRDDPDLELLSHRGDWVAGGFVVARGRGGRSRTDPIGSDKSRFAVQTGNGTGSCANCVKRSSSPRRWKPGDALGTLATKS